jgi:DNA (cytosine-5)-methyltransferase 1
MKFIDLFAGIGGFRMGFEKAGFTCVFSSEVNQRCREVYRKNYQESPFGDIREINADALPYFDVLVAGFPCQPFSICGKKQGFEDTRGTLFFEICRIVAAKQPKVVVLENVKHLIHHDRGNTLAVILQSLKNLNYHVTYQLLNAKNFGVPQNRERIIIIATKAHPFDFSRFGEQEPPPLREFLDPHITPKFGGLGGQKEEELSAEFEFLEKQEYTLIEHPKKQPSGLIFVGYRNKSTWKTGVRPNTEHLSRVHRQPNRIYSIDGIHPTLPSQETSGRFFIYIPEINRVRKMTIRECYRIMGFPEDFKLDSNLGESYKQIGNSVCVPMVEAIAQEIVKQSLTSCVIAV